MCPLAAKPALQAGVLSSIMMVFFSFFRKLKSVYPRRSTAGQCASFGCSAALVAGEAHPANPTAAAAAAARRAVVDLAHVFLDAPLQLGPAGHGGLRMIGRDSDAWSISERGEGTFFRGRENIPSSEPSPGPRRISGQSLGPEQRGTDAVTNSNGAGSTPWASRPGEYQ